MEYVQTASPVASRALVENYEVGVSSATVRNEMSKLEEQGYLTQPHTSAGRIPTESGFRYFVERLMETYTLSPMEQRMIAHQFYQNAGQSPGVDAASRLCIGSHRAGNRHHHQSACQTHTLQTSGAYQHPRARAVLLILVLQGGTVEQQMLALPHPINQPKLSESADRINKLCKGFSASEIEAQLPKVPALEQDILQVIISLMQRVTQIHSAEIYHHGLPELLQEPEFAAGQDTSAKLIRVIEEDSQLRAVISDALSPLNGIGNIRVVIGGESKWEALRACSLVMTRYGVNNYATGALGIVGPIRMPYGRTISVVRFISGVLNELVYDMYRPAKE